MSKSRGNFVSPRDVAEKWGADMVRLWVASQDYFGDVRYSEAAMTQLSETYRKLRNTFRFALSNLADFDPSRDALPDSELWEMDAWMLRRTGDLVRRSLEWYESFDFHRVFHAAHDFAVVDLSSFYFDVLKDRLYTFAPRSVGRRSAQTAVYRIASALLRLIAPILVYTSEEIWKHFPHEAGAPESIHMAHFPKAEELERAATEKIAENWEKLLSVREEVLKALEQARAAKLISAALEAKVMISASGDLAALLANYLKSLPALFIVSQVRLEPSTAEGVSVKVDRADGQKCERCWNYSTHVGENAEYPTICERCVAALDEIARTTSVAGS
jgi:isoleucyl-tRNA synthetase